MEKIEDVNLSELVKEASSELVADKRKQAAGLVKKELQRIEQLNLDIKKLDKEKQKKQEKLDKAQAKINKIKAGDWSLLAEQKENQGG